MLIYKSVEDGWKKKIKVLGFTIYNRFLENNYCNEVYFKILKFKHNPKELKIYLLGIQVANIIKAIQFNDIEKLLLRERKIVLKEFERLRKINQLQLIAANLHPKTFGEFKNCHNNQDIVLVGSGPSLNFYNPINSLKHCGLNKAFTFEKIKFNYLFTNDGGFLSMGDVTSDFINYQGNNCIKFLGDHNGKKDWQIPESLCLKIENCRRYKTNAWTYKSEFAFNIETEIIGNFCTISLQAMQFLLYTNPSKIYLVGIDTSNIGHFGGSEYDEKSRGGEDLNDLHNWAQRDWRYLKEFAKIYYPDTEIISVNPVGLRGIFRDVYTKEYVEANIEDFKEKLNDIEYLEDLTNKEEELCLQKP